MTPSSRRPERAGGGRALFALMCVAGALAGWGAFEVVNDVPVSIIAALVVVLVLISVVQPGRSARRS
jgi:hypothetical protein